MIERDKAKEKLLKDHIAWAKSNELCTQCTYPWHDGICECGEFNTFKVKLAYDIAGQLMTREDSLNDLK
jgi:hypothetical protein